jgi:hypothetical protein
MPLLLKGLRQFYLLRGRRMSLVAMCGLTGIECDEDKAA